VSDQIATTALHDTAEARGHAAIQHTECYLSVFESFLSSLDALAPRGLVEILGSLHIAGAREFRRLVEAVGFRVQAARRDPAREVLDLAPVERLGREVAPGELRADLGLFSVGHPTRMRVPDFASRGHLPMSRGTGHARLRDAGRARNGSRARASPSRKSGGSRA
jgi:hypothetical protein